MNWQSSLKRYEKISLAYLSLPWTTYTDVWVQVYIHICFMMRRNGFMSSETCLIEWIAKVATLLPYGQREEEERVFHTWCIMILQLLYSELFKFHILAKSGIHVYTDNVPVNAFSPIIVIPSVFSFQNSTPFYTHELETLLQYSIHNFQQYVFLWYTLKRAYIISVKNILLWNIDF